MAQFDVHENNNPESRRRTPYLLNMQADILESLQTRVVVPLRPCKSSESKPISRLHPVLEIDGKGYVAYVSEMAGIPSGVLRKSIQSAKENRQELIAATDLLLTGF
jgi:toxin CcdB